MNKGLTKNKTLFKKENKLELSIVAIAITLKVIENYTIFQILLQCQFF